MTSLGPEWDITLGNMQQKCAISQKMLNKQKTCLVSILIARNKIFIYSENEFTLRVIEDTTEFAGLREHWNELLANLASNNIFSQRSG